MIEDTTILPPLSNSDHNVISFSLVVEERMSDDSTVRIVDYNKADWEGIRDVLGRVEWDEWLTDNATTEENLETFTTIIESTCKGIPTRKKTRRMRSVWMNRKARHGRSTDRQAMQETTNNIGKRSTRLQRQ